MRRRIRCLGVLLGVAWVSAVPTRANVAEVGKGFVLGTVGTVTADAAAVISGKQSIQGAYFDGATSNAILFTDSSIYPLAANHSYTVTFRYRVLAAAPSNFQAFFFSSAASKAGSFLPSEFFGGGTGTSGTVTFKRSLANFPDYQVFWGLGGPAGAIAIDDIQIVQDDTNQLMAAEDGEGPGVLPGPLNFQVIDSQTFPPVKAAAGQNYVMPSVTAQDLDGDGRPEIIVTLTTYPDQVPQTPIILGTAPTLSLDTTKFFPGGAPTLRQSLINLFVDLDGDGLKDILFSESGLDHPPWTGSGIGVGLGIGRGTYRDISSLVPAPQQATRTFALGAADLDGDGRADVLLPDQNGTNPVLLRWNGAGFTVQQNWIDQRLWAAPTQLSALSWVGFADLDGDGRQDLIVTGQTTTPAFRVLFGKSGAFAADSLVQLPDGPFGHAPVLNAAPAVQGGNVDHVVVADFNNDGRPDLFALEEQVFHVLPGAITDTNVPGYADLLKNGGTYYGDIGLQVLRNDGSRHFSDISAASSAQNLGKRLYHSPVAVDINNDGFLDVVTAYSTKQYGGQTGNLYGTTFFLNDGTGAFQVVDGAQLLPVATTNPPGDQRWNLGSFVVTSVAPNRTEGVIVNPLGNGSIDVYRVAANSAVGTGPHFSDSASLGVSGFNEFYYLHQHPEVAAAIQRGEYRSGLEHYLAVGQDKGYARHAPSSR
jgi:hypothetical protein